MRNTLLAVSLLFLLVGNGSARVGDHADSVQVKTVSYVSLYKPSQMTIKGCLELKREMQKIPYQPEGILGTLLLMSMVDSCMEHWKQDSQHFE